AETGERFVDRVVDDLVDQVVQAVEVRVADVHARTFANSFQALEDRDGSGSVLSGTLAFVVRSELVFHRCGKPDSPINSGGFLLSESRRFLGCNRLEGLEK